MNQKGGVGKTTTTINLGHALAITGKRVTVLDMDPQGQVAVGYGLENSEIGLDKVLLEDMPIDELTISVRENLDVVPAGQQLADYEQVSTGGSGRGPLRPSFRSDRPPGDRWSPDRAGRRLCTPSETDRSRGRSTWGP